MMRRQGRTFGVCVVLATGALLLAASPTLAASPWWHLISGSRPSYIDPGSARDEVQELTVSATAGAFTLNSAGDITAPIAFNAPAAAVRSALEALPDVGAGNVEVSGGPGASAPYLITYVGALADQAVTTPTADTSKLNGAGKSAAVVELAAGRSDGEIYLIALNLGTADVSAGAQFKDVLPADLKALSITATEPEIEANFLNRGLIPCELATLTCTLSNPLVPYDDVEVRIAVNAEPGAASGALNEVIASGGGTAAVALKRPVTISSAPVPFGVEDYEMALEEEGGAPDNQAGSHPFQFTTEIELNQEQETAPPHTTEPEVAPPSLGKDFNFELPPGLIGNPTPLPRCTLAQFYKFGNQTVDPESNICPPQSAVGVITVAVHLPTQHYLTVTEPIYNLEPGFGEPARFGFFVVIANDPVIIDTSVRSGSDYGITANVRSLSQSNALLSSTAVFWGTPGDPRHDGQRGYGCLHEARGITHHDPCLVSEGQAPVPLFSLPTRCGKPLQTSVEANSWTDRTFADFPGSFLPSAPLVGCNQLVFSPTISAEPTAESASSPSGLDFNLDFHDEGLVNAAGTAQSQLNKTVVTLPEGFTINPSAGVGLAGCTEADYARETVESAPGAGCPNDSKLGTVEIETPLLAQKIQGSIFIAQPYENPSGSLVALYVVAKNPETGILVKLAGEVTPNPVTGQLVTTFENNPQLPFDHFNFHFREGQQAPLISPPTCAVYTLQATLTPWSDPTAALTDASSFTITKGAEGGPCPAGNTPPFRPGIQSGMQNNNAGVFSPFYLHLTRTDGEQYISGFSTDLPPGLTGDLTGIPFCPEADIAAARAKTGAQEEAEPSCPAASQVGHTLVGTGVGAVLAYVPGKVYLAGPFDGAPFSLVSVTSAVVGPFDLGTVVLRFGLSINPYTAQVSVSPTSSEPIPTIIKGIVTHVRDIRVYIERPGNAPFTLNPTSCAPMAIGSTLNSPLGASATVTSPFQAASCANLKFSPKFAVSTSAKTSKANGASLHVALTYPAAPQGTYADIAKVKVELPKQLPSRLTTLQKACTNAQFEANPAGCPSPSVIGTARAVVPNIPEPLTGPVYFVSHGGEAFPSLEVVLQGYGVKVILVGSTFISKAGVTSTTFKTVPDNPVSSFELTLPEGKYSALAANGNLCTQKLTMPADFTGQNGMQADYKTAVSVTGCAKAKALTRSQKLARALKTCKRDKKKAKRAMCEKTARKKYGPLNVKRKAKKKNQAKR